MRGLSNGPPLRRRLHTTSTASRRSRAGAHSGILSILPIQTGSTNSRGTVMNATSIAMAEQGIEWDRPSRGRVGMFGLIAAEAAIFTIFVVAYLFYIGKSLTGPMPKDVLHVTIFFTVCLLSSSLTIHFAVKSLKSAKIGPFALWWFLTLTLGATFLYGTDPESRHST